MTAARSIMIMLDLQLVFSSVNLVLTWAVMVYIWVVARYFNTGIFPRFFTLMKVAVLFTAANSVFVYLRVVGSLPQTLVGIDTILPTISILLFLASFISLLNDWKRVRMDEPLRQRVA